MRAVKTQHVKPGKGGAFAQIELKDIRDGTKMNERFRADDTVERVTLEQRAYTYLYAEGDMLTFMDMESYEQISLPENVVGEPMRFLQENMAVEIELYEGEPIGVTLPETVVLEIQEADAVVKGQTASSSYKPAILENGVRLMVPPHIGTGTKIVVDTTNAEYKERFKG